MKQAGAVSQTEAYSQIAGEDASGVVITCEHASQRLPEPWQWPKEDARLVGTHWAYDLGAAELARALAARLRAPAILSRFTRLLADPNRPEDSPTLFRARADGAPIHINLSVDSRDRELRLERYYRAYHRAADQLVANHAAPLLLSIHTFTPAYEGKSRSMEIGVLYDRDEELARRCAAHLDDAGFISALNEPYSGKEGLMYAVDRHAVRYGRRALEIEVRQDLAVDNAMQERIVAELEAFLRALSA